MKTKSKQLIKGIILAQVVLGTQLAAKSLVKPQKNILFIAVDDMKPLLGCYGDSLAVTPNMDKLASKGTLFTRAYCQQAVSGPSRASLLTGLCPDRTKVWDLKTLIRDINPNVITLPQHLSNSGFETVGVGKIFDSRSVDAAQDKLSWSVNYLKDVDYSKSAGKGLLGHYHSEEVKKQYEFFRQEGIAQGKKGKGLENYLTAKVKPSVESMDVPDDAYADGAITNRTIRYIEEYSGEKPLFMAIGIKSPHLPFCAPKKYWDLYKKEDIKIASFRQKAANSPDIAYTKSGELFKYTDIPPLASFSDIQNMILPDAKAQELIHAYYATVSYVDAQVGKLIEVLEKKGMLENTIIVLWGDHGWHLGDHGLWCKHTNFENATHSPLIIYNPEIKPSVVTHPVEFLDIFPTLCEMTSIATPEGLDGVSLVNSMKKPKKHINPYAVSQYPGAKVYPGGKHTLMGYSIRSNRFRYTVWCDWRNRILNPEVVVAEELYDYEKDHLETKNLMNEPKYIKVIAQMKGYWEDYKAKRIN